MMCENIEKLEGNTVSEEEIYFLCATHSGMKTRRPLFLMA